MRLIDADALIKLIKNSCSMGGYMGKVVEAIYEYFIKVVESMPTAVDLPELKEAYQDGYKDGQNDRPQGEWIDYDNTFYKCPECGYLLEKCCPQCQNKVILPKGGAE